VCGGCSAVFGIRAEDYVAADARDASAAGAGDGGTSGGGGDAGGVDGGGGTDGGGTGPVVYRAAVLADGASAYWRLGERSGTQAGDEGSRHLVGTYQAGCVLGAPGALAGDPDTAVTFDGGSCWVDLGSIATVDFPGVATFSVEAWIKPSVHDALYHHVFSAESFSTSRQGYALLLEEPNGLSFERFVSGSNAKAWVATNPSSGVFTYVVGTFDGSALKLYVDGKEVASAPDARSAPPQAGTAFIGVSGAGTYQFAGDLDEVAVYPKALAADRISAHYAIGSGK
jgi:hypothetical protein